MAPPMHIKVITALLQSTGLIAGVRNVVAPGTSLFFMPFDDTFQSHFKFTPEFTWITQLFGCFMLMVSTTKLITVFGHVEGTFLRKKLFIALGIIDLLTAVIIGMYDGLPMKVTGGFAVLHGLEGLAFLADAFLRPRPLKAVKKKYPKPDPAKSPAASTRSKSPARKR